MKPAVFLNRSFDIDRADDWIPLLKEMLAGEYPGLLATIDENGVPQMRWMSTVSFEYLPNLFALTSPHSPKVAQIARNPMVSWMFFNVDLSLIVNLQGSAEILRDDVTIRSVWRTLSEERQRLFLDQYLNGERGVVIRTRVARIDCHSPINNLSFEADPRKLGGTVPHHETFEDRSILVPPAKAARH